MSIYDPLADTEWKTVIKDEMGALDHNYTWKLDPNPLYKK